MPRSPLSMSGTFPMDTAVLKMTLSSRALFAPNTSESSLLHVTATFSLHSTAATRRITRRSTARPTWPWSPRITASTIAQREPCPSLLRRQRHRQCDRRPRRRTCTPTHPCTRKPLPQHLWRHTSTSFLSERHHPQPSATPRPPPWLPFRASRHRDSVILTFSPVDPLRPLLAAMAPRPHPRHQAILATFLVRPPSNRFRRTQFCPCMHNRRRHPGRSSAPRCSSSRSLEWAHMARTPAESRVDNTALRLRRTVLHRRHTVLHRRHTAQRRLRMALLRRPLRSSRHLHSPDCMECPRRNSSRRCMALTPTL
eukprot:Opistho-2@74324